VIEPLSAGAGPRGRSPAGANLPGPAWIEVHVWTVDEAEQMNRLIGLGSPAC
jgi:hypothetical protein